MLSLPFALFTLPLLFEALTHSRPTGYDEAGACVRKLTARERARKVDQEQRARQKRYEDQLNWAALAVGVAYCLYKWQVDKRQRRERLAYLMGDAAGNGKKGGKNKSK